MTTETLARDQPLQAPRVNLNGTSKTGLINDLLNAAAAINAANAVLEHTAPHPRDYQTFPTNQEYEQARLQYHARWIALHTIRRDLMTLAEMIDAQGNT